MVLSLGSWNYCPAEQGPTAQHIPKIEQSSCHSMTAMLLYADNLDLTRPEKLQIHQILSLGDWVISGRVLCPLIMAILNLAKIVVVTTIPFV